MSERLEALQSKLPPAVLSLIRDYDSHPVSDMIREIEFTRYPGIVHTVSSMRLRNCKIWPPSARRMIRLFRNTWIMSFDRRRFETLEQFDYLPDWVTYEKRFAFDYSLLENGRRKTQPFNQNTP